MVHFRIEMTSAEFRPRNEIINPHAPNFSELNYHVRIDAMTQDDKLHWLSDHILKEEQRLLREPYNMPQAKPEAKIMFLTGGPKSDVTEARDFEGNLIHTRHLDHPRPMFAEIPEAQGAIHHWFDMNQLSRDQNSPPPSPVPPLSEVSDVVYNVCHLMTLDEFFWDEYNAYLKRISDSLGFSLDQLLTLAVYKYNFRLGQGKTQKNINLENDIIGKVLSKVGPDGKPTFPIPTETQFQKTFHTLSEVQTLLNTRLEQLRQEYEWNKNPAS